MSKPRAPKPADVARWVRAIVDAPVPTTPGASLPCYRKRDVALNRLASHGLDATGNPKPAQVAT